MARRSSVKSSASQATSLLTQDADFALRSRATWRADFYTGQAGGVLVGWRATEPPHPLASADLSTAAILLDIPLIRLPRRPHPRRLPLFPPCRPAHQARRWRVQRGASPTAANGGRCTRGNLCGLSNRWLASDRLSGGSSRRRGAWAAKPIATYAVVRPCIQRPFGHG